MRLIRKHMEALVGLTEAVDSRPGEIVKDSGLLDASVPSAEFTILQGSNCTLGHAIGMTFDERPYFTNVYDMRFFRTEYNDETIHHVIICPGFAVSPNNPAILDLAKEISTLKVKVHIVNIEEYETINTFDTRELTEAFVDTITTSLRDGDSLSFTGHSAGNDVIYLLLQKILSNEFRLDIKLWINIVGRPTYENLSLYGDAAFLAAWDSLRNRAAAVQGRNKRIKSLLKCWDDLFRHSIALGSLVRPIQTFYIVASDDELFPARLYSLPATAQKLILKGKHDLLFTDNEVVVEECLRALKRSFQ